MCNGVPVYYKTGNIDMMPAQGWREGQPYTVGGPSVWPGYYLGHQDAPLLVLVGGLSLTKIRRGLFVWRSHIYILPEFRTPASVKS